MNTLLLRINTPLRLMTETRIEPISHSSNQNISFPINLCICSIFYLVLVLFLTKKIDHDTRSLLEKILKNEHLRVTLLKAKKKRLWIKGKFTKWQAQILQLIAYFDTINGR